MKLLHFLIFILLLNPSFGQTIDEMEYDLSVLYANQKEGDKINIARKLLQKDPFNYIGTQYLLSYYVDRDIDSLSVYFDNLTKRFPGKTEPYLLRAEFVYFEADPHDRDNYIKKKTEYLKASYKINPADKPTVFMLAEEFYRDFIYPLEKQKYLYSDLYLLDSTLFKPIKELKKSTFEHSADSALKYLLEAWDLSIKKRDIIYYPIRQLECYLKIEDSKISAHTEKDFLTCFFPSAFFANLNQLWQCDSTVDYLFEIESAKRTAEGLTSQLSNLHESCLYSSEVNSSTVIYRFTWLRTFHNPVCIRIEKSDEGIMLYWKTGKGAGGYEPEGLKKSGKKRLELSDWTRFQDLLVRAGFDDLPNKYYIPMYDGATWTLEKKTSGDFKAHNTNEPDEDFKEACLFLLKFTRIKVKKDEIY